MLSCVYNVVLVSVSRVCTCMDMSIALQCVPVGAHLGILVGLVLLSCTRAWPINKIDFIENGQTLRIGKW